MSVFKDLRFVSLIVLVVVALGLIGSPTFLKARSITVDFVDANSKCPLKEGDVVNQIYSVVITDAESFSKALGNVRGGDRVAMVVNGAPFGCEAVADNSLGFSVKENELETLRFGIDIEGGTRVLLNPTEEITKEQLTETVKTLENRINFYGLKEVKVNVLGNNLIQIETSDASGDDIRNFLARQGKFAGKLSERIKFLDGKGELIIGNKTFDVSIEQNKFFIENRGYSVNDTFLLEQEKFQVISINNTSAIVYADLFTDKDIVNVLSGTQQSGIRPVGEGFYEFSFGVQVSREGAKKFAKLTEGQPIEGISGNERYIQPKLVLFLDERLITELNIVAQLAGQEVTSATITGTGRSLEEASREKLRLESTLRSGSLPVKLEIAKVDTITQTAGRDLINSTVFVALASIIAVSGIVYYRYRDYRIVVPMVLMSLSEVAIVVGIAASQIFAGFVIAIAVAIGILKREITGVVGWITLIVMIMVAATVAISPWTIDIPVIAGLIAILGTGVNQMIIMTDQLFKEKGRPLAERHKSAMKIIWSSAAIVVFAMIPLIFGGIGSLKGFAIATIVGVLVGILVTRPAYVALIEKIKRIQLESV